MAQKEDPVVNQTAEVDAYLAAQTDVSRAALQDLRAVIKAAVPEAAEIMSYGVPTFRYQRNLVSMGAAKNHCALYVMSPAIMDALKDDLASIDTSRGTIRFPPDQPLPAALVRKIIRARVAEAEAAAKKSSSKKASTSEK